MKHKNNSYELHLYYIELNKPDMRWVDDFYIKYRASLQKISF